MGGDPMMCPNCHPAFVSGFELGLALRCRRDIEATWHEALHAAIRPMILEVVADMNRRGAGDHQALTERRRQHQIEACERNQADARPWPVEAGEPW